MLNLIEGILRQLDNAAYCCEMDLQDEPILLAREEGMILALQSVCDLIGIPNKQQLATCQAARKRAQIHAAEKPTDQDDLDACMASFDRIPTTDPHHDAEDAHAPSRACTSCD